MLCVAGARVKVDNGSIQILMVEDNVGDVYLTMEAFKAANIPHHLNVVHDGVEAVDYLHREGKYAAATRPDLMLLDLNLPRKDGRGVLAEVKQDPYLRQIPVVVLTSSSADQDVAMAYDLHANCYIVKPAAFADLVSVVEAIHHFWLRSVKLPANAQ
jgi:CheY-like chemotaxis protein